MFFTSSESLSGDIFTTQSVTINTSVTLTTEGHSIVAGATFTNNGIIDTGALGNGAVQPGFISSNGGSGSYGIYIQANAINAGIINSNGQTPATFCQGGSSGGASNYFNFVDGGSTTAIGGQTTSCGNNEFTSNGTSATAPSVTDTLINTWHNGGFINYLSGAGGGAGTYPNPQTAPSNWSITTSYGGSGGAAQGTCSAEYGPGGGGGGGTLLFAYGPGGLNKGTYNVSGGHGADNTCGGDIYNIRGGNGIVLNYSWSTPPLSP